MKVVRVIATHTRTTYLTNKLPRSLNDSDAGTKSIGISRLIGLQVDHFFKKQNDAWIRAVFDKHMDPKTKLLPPNRFVSALRELDTQIDGSEEIETLFHSLDLNGDGALAFPEFRRCLEFRSPLDQWAATLPLAPLLASCLPIACRGDAARALCCLSAASLTAALSAYADGVRRLVEAKLEELRLGYEELDLRAAEQASGIGDKFRMSDMACGSIEDFHKGMQDRIGEAAAAVCTRVHCPSPLTRDRTVPPAFDSGPTPGVRSRR